MEDRDSGLQPRPRVGGGLRVHHRARLPQGEGNRTRGSRQERLVYQVTAPRLLSSIFVWLNIKETHKGEIKADKDQTKP